MLLLLGSQISMCKTDHSIHLVSHDKLPSRTPSKLQHTLSVLRTQIIYNFIIYCAQKKLQKLLNKFIIYIMHYTEHQM